MGIVVKGRVHFEQTPRLEWFVRCERLLPPPPAECGGTDIHDHNHAYVHIHNTHRRGRRRSTFASAFLLSAGSFVFRSGGSSSGDLLRKAGGVFVWQDPRYRCQ